LTISVATILVTVKVKGVAEPAVETSVTASAWVFRVSPVVRLVARVTAPPAPDV
jgi:hypothetical protein